MTLHLWQGFGVELEYMIVDRDTLAAKPICDTLLRQVSGGLDDVERGDAAWSNELVLHVVEFKTNGPAPSLEPLPALFADQVRTANDALRKHNAMLLGGAMHPFFDPVTETRIWPHDYNVVYETYNRIFDCRGHGWSNLQATHLNLPFADDTEFARLHAAVRYVLPLLPGLAAASPVAEGRVQKALDFRLVNYAGNSARIPSSTGQVIPEPLYTRDEYYAGILEKIWADTAPFDPDGNLQGEFANARGAIARFDRMAIEIRVLDIQECPLADVAICAAIVEVLKALVCERWLPITEIARTEVAPLAAILRQGFVEAENTVVSDLAYLRGFGIDEPLPVNEIWHHLAHETGLAQPMLGVLRHIEKQGTLATRIVRALGSTPTRSGIESVYRELADCLAANRLFETV
ncbi:MAG: glutamate--cysteine ligase [Planctomycetes bacterium]|nr:glutamate--cysteine ligase [Planctomycetota bacterium]MCW8134060.1 glutamate--cysteine ligase [Planctomycetota bacterium]